MYSYVGLYERLRRAGITQTGLTAIGISSCTIADYLSCDTGSLCRAISPNPLIQTLWDGKAGQRPDREARWASHLGHGEAGPADLVSETE